MVTRNHISILVLLLLPTTSIIPKGVFTLEVTANEFAECTCTCVAFRLDDVQDYFLNKTQKKIIDTFRDTNSSLTLGIIGNAFGKDKALVKTVNDAIKSDPYIEIANHGWNHEDFTKFDKNQQFELIKKTNEKLSSLLLTKRPTGFIPPYNSFNKDTISALHLANMGYISANLSILTEPSSVERYKIFVSDTFKENDKQRVNQTKSESRLYSFPNTAKTGYVSSNNWHVESLQQTLEEIHNSIDKYKFAVVLMHPQEFSVRNVTGFENNYNSKQINQLELLLQKLKAENMSLVPLKDLDKC